MVGVLLFKPDSGVYATIENLKDGAEARAFFESALPPLLPFLRAEDLERFACRSRKALGSYGWSEDDV